MKAYAQRVLLLLLMLPFLLSLAVVRAETQTPERVYSQAELDQMLAPIALYPDPLLLQILMAATYPLEIVEAARWSRAHPQLQGQDAVKAVDDRNWDPSVKSLVAFPRVLQRMDEKLEWTEQLGDAFLAQQSHVMDAVQRLRKRAYEAGNLQSSEHQRVVRQDDTIIIEPANPAVVYVPYYNPGVVYGSWWWPAYPPVYWAPWPGYYVTPGFGFAWGVGIFVGANFFFGASNWHHHHVHVVDAHPFYYHHPHFHPIPDKFWHHDPYHRRGVPYRHPWVRERYHPITAPDVRRAYRGYPPPPYHQPVPAPRPDVPHVGHGRPPGDHRASLPVPAPGTPLPSPGDIRRFPHAAPPSSPKLPPHAGRFPSNVPPAPGTPLPSPGDIRKFPHTVPQLPSTPGVTSPPVRHVPRHPPVAPGTPMPSAPLRAPNAPIARSTPTPQPHVHGNISSGMEVRRHIERGHASGQPPPVTRAPSMQAAPRVGGGNFPGIFGGQRGAR